MIQPSVRSLLLMFVIAGVASSLRAAEAPLVAIAKAKEHVGEQARIEMVVKSSRLLESGKYCFLNSEKSFTNKANFTVAINAQALAKYQQAGIENPAAHFREQTISVSGKISEYKGQLQIEVADPQQIVTVKTLKPAARK